MTHLSTPSQDLDEPESSRPREGNLPTPPSMAEVLLAIERNRAAQTAALAQIAASTAATAAHLQHLVPGGHQAASGLADF